MLYNTAEPSREKRCWVLFSLGERYGRYALRLREYEWRRERWVRTDTPEETPSSFYRALEKANWIGRLPKVGNKRSVLNGETLEKVRPFWQRGEPIRVLARKAGVSWKTAKVCDGALSTL